VTGSRATRHLCAVTIAVAVGLLNRWDRRWRVSGREAATSLPGDDAVGDPKVRITRRIDIDVSVAEVWPWIVQLGADRGGFYSYDWLENLFGLDMHSADGIVQRWQDLAVGDLVRADRRGRGGWYVVALEPVDTVAMVLADVPAGRPAQRDRGAEWEFLWTFHLQRISDDRRAADGCRWPWGTASAGGSRSVSPAEHDGCS
jgi:hypothetical protein